MLSGDSSIALERLDEYYQESNNSVEGALALPAFAGDDGQVVYAHGN